MNANTNTPLRRVATSAIPINGSWICTRCHQPVPLDAVTVDGDVLHRSCAEERLLIEAVNQCCLEHVIPAFSVDSVIAVLERMRSDNATPEPEPDPKAVHVGQRYRSTDRRDGERIVKVLGFKSVPGVGRRAVVQRCSPDGSTTYGIKTSLAIYGERLDTSHWTLLPSGEP